ncbi:hypothetical protein Q0N30_15970 [Priestia megaterium]|uniref:hypothetical protein n=1 Tax=Priestia megaterium TaxID=1404 RepID=UPI003459BC83
MDKNFEMKILTQHWIDEKFKDEDLCSQGEIYLNVNDVIVTQSGLDEEWGISLLLIHGSEM